MKYKIHRDWIMIIGGFLLSLAALPDSISLLKNILNFILMEESLRLIAGIVGVILMGKGIFGRVQIFLSISPDTEIRWAGCLFTMVPLGLLICLFVLFIFTMRDVPNDVINYLFCPHNKSEWPCSWDDIDVFATTQQKVLELIGWAMGGMLLTISAGLFERRAHIEKRNIELLEKESVRNRFNYAVENIANELPAKRTASFYQFYDLAKDLHEEKESQHDNLKQEACDILCVHLRKMFPKQDNSSAECKILEEVLRKFKSELGITYSVINNDAGKKDYLTAIRR